MMHKWNWRQQVITVVKRDPLIEEGKCWPLGNENKFELSNTNGRVCLLASVLPY